MQLTRPGRVCTAAGTRPGRFVLETIGISQLVHQRKDKLVNCYSHDEKAEQEGLDHLPGVELDRVDHRFRALRFRVIRSGTCCRKRTKSCPFHQHIPQSGPIAIVGQSVPDYSVRRLQQETHKIVPLSRTRFLKRPNRNSRSVGPGLYGKAPAAGNARRRAPSKNTFPRVAHSQ